MSRLATISAGLLLGLLAAAPLRADELLFQPALDRAPAGEALEAILAAIAGEPRDARVPLLLDALREHWDLVPGGKARCLEALRPLAEELGGHFHADSLLTTLAVLERAVGEREQALARLNERGYLERFWVAGPFGVARNASLQQVFGPELAAAQRELDPAARFAALRGERGWLPLEREAWRSGVNLSRALSESGQASYALTHVRADAETAGFLVYRGPSAKFWLNRADLATVDRIALRLGSEVRLPLRLRPGWNRLLLKLVGGRSASFSLRLVDAAGAPLRLETSAEPRPVELVRAARVEPLPGHVLASLDEAREPTRRALRVRALLDVGMGEEAWLALGALETDAPQLREKAWFQALRARAAQRADHLPEATRRDLARQACEAARRLDPAAVAPRRRLAEFALDDDRRVEGVLALEAILADHPAHLPTRLRVFDVFLRQEWTHEAEQVLDEAERRHGSPPAILRARARLLEAQGRPDEAQAVRERLLAEDAGQIWVIARRLERALERGDAGAARGAWEDYERRALARSSEGHVQQARLARARGDRAGERAALTASVAARPANLARRLLLARRLAEDALTPGDETQRAAWREEALAQLGEVLAVRPEAHEARHLRRHLQSEAEDRFWEEWTPPLQEILEAAPESSHWPRATTACLFDQTVSRIYPDASAEEVVHQVWRVLNEQGKERYGERPDYGDTLEIRTITPEGRVLEPIRTSAGNYQMPGLTPGAALEHAFKLERSAPDFQYSNGPFYFMDPDLSEPFWFSRWVLIIHEDAPVRIVERNMRRPGISKKVETRGPWRVHVYTARNQPRVEREPGAPDRDELLPWIKVIEERSLDTIGARYRERAVPGRLVTPSVARAAAEQVAGLEGDLAKARALYRFVQEHVQRGAGGFRPAQILAARGGSKTTLYLALLRAAGVPAQLVLAGPSPYADAQPDWDHPEPDQFRTRLVRLAPRGGDPLYVFADGHRLAPFGQLPSRLWGAPAYICGEERGTLDLLPEPSLEAEAVVSRLDLELHPEGRITGRVERRMRAYELHRLKETFRSLPEGRMRGFFAQQAAELFPTAAVLEPAFPGIEEVGHPLAFRFAFDAPRALRARPDGRVELRGLLSPAQLSERFGTHRVRAFDLVLEDPTVARDTIRVQLGPYACPQLPRSVTLQHRLGQLSLGYAREAGDVLRIERRLTLRAGRITPADYAGFLEFIRAVDQAEQVPVVLEARAGE